MPRLAALRTQDGRPLRLLNVLDEFTRVATGFEGVLAIGSGRVITVLERLIAEHGKPEVIRSDNRKEFTAASLISWLCEQCVTAVQVAKVSPQQN